MIAGMGQQIDNPFPPLEQADAAGLIYVGGELSPPWLLAAYRRGIFPWPDGDAPDGAIPWWSPDPRAVIEWDNFHVPRRLRQTIRSGRFRVSIDEDFTGVVQGCAQPRRDDAGVWLTEPMQAAFIELHHLGHAHSVEVWQGDQLAGGIYGLALGGYFSAESMFHNARDASKVALARLVDHLRQRGFALLDIQILTEHTQRLGASEIPRAEFLSRLNESLAIDAAFV